MDYLNRFTQFFAYRSEHYTLEQYRLWHRRWQVIGGLSLLFLLYVIFVPSAAKPVKNHFAKVVVNLNPASQIVANEQLLRAISTDAAKGIVLFIEEGIYDGHNFATVEALGHLIKQARQIKPVVAFIYGYAHGNNYVIATGAEHIVSQETASIGGLSMTSVHYDASELMKRVGIEVVEQGFGDYKTKPKKDSPNYKKFVAHRTKILESLHKWMVEKVMSNRGFKPEQVSRIIDGQWYLGKRAMGLGLVDQVGDLQVAVGWLRAKLHHESEVDSWQLNNYGDADSSMDSSGYSMFENIWKGQMLSRFYVNMERYLQKQVQSIFAAAWMKFVTTAQYG